MHGGFNVSPEAPGEPLGVKSLSRGTRMHPASPTHSATLLAPSGYRFFAAHGFFAGFGLPYTLRMAARCAAMGFFFGLVGCFAI